jgi:hypothetical protein
VLIFSLGCFRLPRGLCLHISVFLAGQPRGREEYMLGLLEGDVQAETYSSAAYGR